MWFTFSLLTILFWGGSDLFSKKGTRPNDNLSHLRLIITVGTVMGIHAILYLAFTGIEFHPISIIKYLPVSLLYIISMALGYMGLRYIELSVSSPICNSSGAVTAVLCFFILGQTMASLQLMGVLLITLGIFLLSLYQKVMSDKEKDPLDKPDRKYTVSFLAILFPILYCIIDGAGSFLDAFYLENIMDEAQANTSYELTFLICAIICFVYLRFVKGERFSYIKEKDFCLGALCETAGQFTYVYAMSDNAIVAAPMIASYSIFSVLLSRIFLKERLSKLQYLLIFIVMAGIAILGIFDA